MQEVMYIASPAPFLPETKQAQNRGIASTRRRERALGIFIFLFLLVFRVEESGVLSLGIEEGEEAWRCEFPNEIKVLVTVTCVRDMYLLLVVTKGSVKEVQRKDIWHKIKL